MGEFFTNNIFLKDVYSKKYKKLLELNNKNITQLSVGNDFNKHLSKDMQVANKYMKICPLN